MSNQLTVKNKQSIGKQQKLLKAIAEVGEETEISFAKKTIDFIKLKDLSDDDLEIGLGGLFVRISNLLGIKDPVSDLNKIDIIEMLELKFKTISLEEINYAFKLERYNSLPPKSEHFQLFNAEYVSEVLTKYKSWLQKTRHDNNLPLSRPKQQPEISQEEKDSIILNGCINCFDEWNQTKEIINGYAWVHDHLMDLKLLEFTEEEKLIMWKKAKSNLLEKSKDLDYETAKDITRELQKKQSNIQQVEYKLIRVSRYFEKIKAKGNHIKDLV